MGINDPKCDLSFPNTVCKKCNSNLQYVVLKGNRYGIYCSNCASFIKWADQSETTVIKARKAWLKEHE